MPSKPYFKFFPSDYLNDTRKLTLEEHGAYLLLLCEHWRRGYIPADIEELRTVFPHSTRPKIRKTLAKLLGFFYEKNGKLFSKRLVAMQEEIEEKSRTNSKNARARWDATASKSHTKSQCLPQPQPEGDGASPPQGGDSPIPKTSSSSSDQNVERGAENESALAADALSDPSPTNGIEEILAIARDHPSHAGALQPEQCIAVLEFYAEPVPAWPCDCADNRMCPHRRALYTATRETIHRAKIKI